MKDLCGKIAGIGPGVLVYGFEQINHQKAELHNLSHNLFSMCAVCSEGA